MTLRTAILGAVGLALAAGTVAWTGGRPILKAVHSTQPTTTAPAGEAARRTVEAVRPVRQTMSRETLLPATVEPFEEADLYAKVSGYVGEVRVDIGDQVKAGDVLVTIDAPEYGDALKHAEAVLAARRAKADALRARAHAAELAVETARADEAARASDLELQQLTARRKAELLAGRAIPEQENDEAQSKLAVAQAQVNMAAARRNGAAGDWQAALADVRAAESDVGVAEADVAIARTNVQYTRIVAPFDGTITRRLINRGDLVQSATNTRTTPLLVIERTDILRVFVDVPEPDVRNVRAGTAVEIEPYAQPGEIIGGAVTRVASALDAASRTMRAETDVPREGTVLLSGMYAQVTLVLEQHADALTVPASAIMQRGADAFVYTVRNDRAVQTVVKTGLSDGRRIEVIDGLQDHDLVIMGGTGSITAGQVVELPVR